MPFLEPMLPLYLFWYVVKQLLLLVIDVAYDTGLVLWAFRRGLLMMGVCLFFVLWIMILHHGKTEQDRLFPSPQTRTRKDGRYNV